MFLSHHKEWEHICLFVSPETLFSISKNKIHKNNNVYSLRKKETGFKALSHTATITYQSSYVMNHLCLTIIRIGLSHYDIDVLDWGHSTLVKFKNKMNNIINTTCFLYCFVFWGWGCWCLDTYTVERMTTIQKASSFMHLVELSLIRSQVSSSSDVLILQQTSFLLCIIILYW